MPVVQFFAGDKDYIAKLNLMSVQAGDIQQAKTDTFQYQTDTAQLKQDVLTLKHDTEQIKQQTQAIAVGDLNWQAATENSAISNGDRLQCHAAGIEFTLFDFEQTLNIGHWFNISNYSGGDCYLKTTATLRLTGELGSVENGDRFIIASGESFAFSAVSLTQIRVN